jgi:hypothetical protein
VLAFGLGEGLHSGNHRRNGNSNMLARSTEIGMKRSTCLPLALRILPSAPLAF